MKQIYTLAAVAMLTLSASAQQRQSAVQLTPDNPQASAILRSPARQNCPSKAPLKAASIMDYATDYSWDFKQHLTKGVQPPQNLTFTITDPTTGEVAIAGMWDRATVPAILDMDAGTLTIRNRTVLTNLNGEDISFYLKATDELGLNLLPGATDAESVVGTIEDNLITFPSDVIFAIGNYQDESTGWYTLTSRNSMTRLSNPYDDDNEGWTRLGMATFQDGWLLPAFSIDQTDPKNWYKVELQQNDAEPDYYRLVDPYRGAFPMSEYNESQEAHGYIEFNIADPDNVFFTVTSSGFAYNDPNVPIRVFYCYNLTTFFMMRYQCSAADVKKEMGDDMHYTTFKNGVVHIPSYEVDGRLFNETMWGDQSEQGSGWEENDGTPVNMETKIWFPGVNPFGAVDAIDDDNDAPVRYFNLQGLEVSNPGPGIYIRTRGSKVTKKVIR